MAKYLVLVEIDVEKELLKTVKDIGDALRSVIGDAIVTVEKAVNLKFVDRHEGIQVEEFVGPDGAQAEVSVQPFKFSSGQFVDVVVLPGDAPRKM